MRGDEKMRIGYACLTIGTYGTGFKRCLKKSADNLVLSSIIEDNLAALEKMIDYNIENSIGLFRISSDLIPFGSSPVNRLEWRKLYASRLSSIGEKIQSSGMRVSMHPGQYTVINSPDGDVVGRAFADLRYHTDVLDSLGVGPENKIILHVGGVYGDKNQAVKRFEDNFCRLDEAIQSRLAIENDERCYHIGDVLGIGEQLGIPVVFDNLHHAVHPDAPEGDGMKWLRACAHTWGKQDGPQKIHYAQQNPGKRPGAHSSTIRIDPFLEFASKLDRGIDMMLEVKDKNLSAVKCINCTAQDGKIDVLKKEWEKYKYKVLENDPSGYRAERELLKDKNRYPATEFYRIIERAIETEVKPGNAEKAALHLWRYFKYQATEKEKKNFFRRLDDFRHNRSGIKPVKNLLHRLSEKYEQKNLHDSYYFIL
ncbi:MAG TPA: UV DNA damage repair endonuclease UvsE [Clostridia bacterium]|nr:UV DNA damage repair endonuclease UvsE [Clostridia bacterium]